MWVITALQEGPRPAALLLDDVRSLDGPIGHGTLFATLARLERLALVERAPDGGPRRAYRLTRRGSAAAGSGAALRAGATQ